MGWRALPTAVFLTAAVSVYVFGNIVVADAATALRGSVSGYKGTNAEIGRVMISDNRKLHKSRILMDNNTSGGMATVAVPSALQLGSPRRKLILHIGPHKTGTTAFQSWLRINKGISPTLQYPKVCGSIQLSYWYHYLAAGLCGVRVPKVSPQSPFPDCPPTAENFLSSIGEGNSDSSDLIISSETFSKCSPTQLANIKAVFGRSFDVEVVLMRRDSKSLFLSRYHQWHKNTQSHVTAFAETLMRGDNRQGFCSYTGLECLQDLGHVFGPEKVHVVSYEGLLAVGKEFAEVVCDVFSASSGCYAAPSKDDEAYHPNKSSSHLAYSAATIFNHFKMITGCSEPKVNDRDLDFFIGALDKANVPKSCYPIARIPSIDCDTCFQEAILNNNVTIAGIKRYYFLEGAAYIASSDAEVCEYLESAIFENPRTYEAVAAATIELSSSCSRRKGQQL